MGLLRVSCSSSAASLRRARVVSFGIVCLLRCLELAAGMGAMAGRAAALERLATAAHVHALDRAELANVRLRVRLVTGQAGRFTGALDAGRGEVAARALDQ